MRNFFWRKNGTPIYSQELGHTIKELPPLSIQGVAANAVFISVPQGDILTLVNRYIAAMETEESADWCRCQWIIHPDDADIKRGNCRECGTAKTERIHLDTLDGSHEFKGIRKRRGDEDATCPVHTREGMVVYFFEWIFSDAAKR